MKTESSITKTINPSTVARRLRTACATLLLPVLMLLPSVAVKANFFYGDFICTNIGGGIMIVGYTGSVSAVTIPGTIYGLPVIRIGNGAFYECWSMTSVTIPDSVTSIESFAFCWCLTLTNVTLGTNVTNIGDGAFSACTSLAGITFPDSVASIGRFAFSCCYSLPSVTIPNNVTNIGDIAFEFCTSLNAITVDALNSFYSSVDGVLFDKSTNMLIQCPGGRAGSYTVPDGVANIGSSAFSGCSSLTSITISSGVTNIGTYAFNYCTSLASATIPDGVTGIGSGAFYNCTSLASITIPDKVATIGDYSFYSCTSLTNISIGDSVTSIGSEAFDSCTRLTSVTIPDRVTIIGEAAFQSCSNLASITLGNSVTTIGDRAFSWCISLTSFIIPSSVTSIGSGAFSFCPSLRGAYFQGDAPSADSTVFDSDNNPAVYYMPGTTGWGPMFGGVSTAFWPVRDWLYMNNSGEIAVTGYTGSGGAVTIPSKINGLPVTSIGDWAFDSCSNLTSVSIPSNLTSVGYGSFWNCINLASVRIGNGVTSIGNYAFYSCPSLMSVAIGNNVTRIEYQAFYNCTNLTAVYFQGNAPGLGPYVFSGDNNAIAYYLPGTTSWDKWSGDVPKVLWNPQAQTGDGSFGVQANWFGFNVTGTADIPIVLEASTDLASAAWVPLLNCTLTNGSVYFSDPDWANYPGRFYRIRSP